MLIGFTGRKGSGKDTAAEVFMAQGYYNLKFAHPLKEMLAALMFHQGASEEFIHECLEGTLKEVPNVFLAGRTPRYAMQTLGTEWGRELMDNNFWTNAFRNATDLYKKIVVSDVRFANEVRTIQGLGGKVFRVVRPSLALPDQDHPSEAEIDTLDVDGELINDALSAAEFQSDLMLFFSRPEADIQ